MDNFKNIFPDNLLNIKYVNNNEYLEDNFNRVEFLANYYFENINKGTLNINEYQRFLKKSKYYINSKLDNETPFAGEYVKLIYKLNDLEWFCLIFSVMLKFDEKYRHLFLKLNNGKISYNLILKIYFFKNNVLSIGNYFIILNKMESKMSKFCFSENNFEVDARLFEFIINNIRKEISINGIDTINFKETEKHLKLTIREKTVNEIFNFIEITKKIESVKFIYIYGKLGIGKKTIVKRVAEKLSRFLIMVDAEKIYSEKENGKFYKCIKLACKEAFFTNGCICIENFDLIHIKHKEEIYELFDIFSKYTDTVFILSNENLIDMNYMDNLLWIDIKLDDLTKMESLKIWEKHLAEIKDILNFEVKVSDFSNKFYFNPKQIFGTVNRAKKLGLMLKKKISSKELYECAYKQVINKLSEDATKIEVRHDWNSLYLNGNKKDILMEACMRIKNKHIVYDEWGMKDKVTYGRGVSLLFSGRSGTGKTLAAQVIANELGLELYKINLSQIISKYIGETEKNLNKIFQEAKESNVILLFDETDALFGKRTMIKDSHDKHANVETSFLLQKMEEYEGVIIMTTNFLDNIDRAFFRRISYTLKFEYPNKITRRQIWENMYSKQIPKDADIDLDYLAKQFDLSGGSIKNVVISSAFMASQDKKKSVSMLHILSSIIKEYVKQGRCCITKEEFGEYSYLLDKL
ncbi:MAG: AAA family ATPase [Candidatus Paraimprobicoccus trichonymphae]|uniref:AAA family ATPase n=1 Tax=Candidatus Paraimprobicoccus trichonymphae TaxID=3033793 RepID=A0AA48L064_9FIRM|nr:MAG: AAA family ATPase [Candidatus Paraimprobicoccus trichonymphae]